MPSTTALFTGLSGLATNARRLDVIGNNIANVNSTAFKSNRIHFAPTFSRTLSMGTSPTGLTGGTNPRQVGQGIMISATQRDFQNGAISATGIATDVAIEGDGFFVVQQAGEQFYTRAGSFQLNENNDLVTVSGARVMGYGVDDNYGVVEGQLEGINVPLGVLTVAEATRNMSFSGNFNAAGTPATTGSVHESRAFYLNDPTLDSANLLVDTSIDLTDPANVLYIDDGSGGSSVALEGGSNAMITISGIEKGGQDIGEYTFAFSSTEVAGADAFGTTLQDFMDFMKDVMGLDGSTVSDQSLGGGISFADGVITIRGNEGTAQDLNIDTADMIVNSDSATGINAPFVMTKTASADGESVRTSFVVYDSLGTPITVDLTFVLQEALEGEGTTWEFVAESSDNADVSRLVGLGVVKFDDSGQFISTTNESFSIDRDNGAVSPLTVRMEFADEGGPVSALTGTVSQLAATYQDGSPLGTLASFSIGEDGRISGAFTNGLLRDIGQIALAKFSNAGGLEDAGDNLFRVGANSGEAIIANPLEFGTGRLIGGALEMSNVDLSQEFISMILASTGYSAASRVITTTDELMDRLLALGR